MIVWNGLLANTFATYRENDAACIFASGVSNSQNTDISLFQREVELLIDTLNTNKEKLFVYFSTCGMYDATLIDSEYVKHKLNIEQIIQWSGNTYIIFRISNPVWPTTNPHTILNFLANKIKHDEEFVVWSHAQRNFIDTEDLLKIASSIIDSKNCENSIINIASTKNFGVLEVVHLLEDSIGKKAIYRIEEKWGSPTIDLSRIDEVIQKTHIQFDDDYLQKLIQKYYQI